MEKKNPTNKGRSTGGVLGALRQLLVSRRPRLRIRLPRHNEPPPDLAFTSPTEQLSTQATSSTTPLLTAKAVVVGPPIPAPPRDPNADDSGDESALGEGSDDDDHNETEEQQQKKTGQKKKTKKKTRGRTNSSWVAKLLDQAAPHKDRVHTRKKRKPRADDTAQSMACHALLCVVRDPHSLLLARVFDFLPPLEPGRHCALVNRAMAVSVARYYAQYCDWPRPRAFLAHRLFSARHAVATGLLIHVLAMLPLVDRVRVSATSLAFCRVADSLPLVFTRAYHVPQFLHRLTPSRIESRFQQTTMLHFDGVAPRDAVRLLQFMSDDDGDHFAAVHDIALQRMDGFETESQCVALVQSLFSDRISRTLRSLVLSELHLTDAHFRHVARLFYDGNFPRLETLNLSRNLFSSRFMRDWGRSFCGDRLKGLLRLNVTGVGMGHDDMDRFFECLRRVPQLQELCFSHNFCSVNNMHTLADVCHQLCLTTLQVLHCSAVSASDHGLHFLVEALGVPGACVGLRSLDVSGNDLSTGDQTMRSLADAFSAVRWPQLHDLNLSFTKPSSRGFQLLTHGLAQHKHSALLEIHLAGNDLKSDAFESLIVTMSTGTLHRVKLLNLSDNQMGVVEFELLAHALSHDACPRLQTLLMSGNIAKADGITRFRRVFSCRVARTLHTLDLSGNMIPSHSLALIADELEKGHCKQLQVLNISRNKSPQSVVRFQQLIGSHQCPSLACLQVGYAQSQEQGYAFVRTTRSKMSVDELRQRKQRYFAARMEQIQHENVAKAARATMRCKRQTQLLRERYDQMESQADRALRRRKRVRKSPHLHIHEEIQQLKQNQYHAKVCRTLKGL